MPSRRQTRRRWEAIEGAATREPAAAGEESWEILSRSAFWRVLKRYGIAQLSQRRLNAEHDIWPEEIRRLRPGPKKMGEGPAGLSRHLLGRLLRVLPEEQRAAAERDLLECTVNGQQKALLIRAQVSANREVDGK